MFLLTIVLPVFAASFVTWIVCQCFTIPSNKIETVLKFPRVESIAECTMWTSGFSAIFIGYVLQF